MKYLLDTCVLSELVKPTPDMSVLSWLETRNASELYISAMTIGELKRGIHKLPESRRRSELSAWLEQTIAGFEGRILSFDTQVSEVWAAMTSQSELRGRPMPAFDSIIGSTAYANGCKLVTRNVSDFAGTSIDLINPWHSDR